MLEVTRYLVAAPAVSANEFDVAGVHEVGVKRRVKLPTVPVILRSVKVATPLVFVATVIVPLRVPAPEPEAIVATTFTPEVMTMLPLES